MNPLKQFKNWWLSGYSSLDQDSYVKFDDVEDLLKLVKTPIVAPDPQAEKRIEELMSQQLNNTKLVAHVLAFNMKDELVFDILLPTLSQEEFKKIAKLDPDTELAGASFPADRFLEKIIPSARSTCFSKDPIYWNVEFMAPEESTIREAPVPLPTQCACNTKYGPTDLQKDKIHKITQEELDNALKLLEKLEYIEPYKPPEPHFQAPKEETSSRVGKLTASHEALTSAFARGTTKAINDAHSAGLPVHAISDGKIVKTDPPKEKEPEMSLEDIKVLYSYFLKQANYNKSLGLHGAAVKHFYVADLIRKELEDDSKSKS